jgi:transcriptional regulator with XRE-family HTH domain
MPFSKTLGQVIRRRRKELGLTQEELAELIGSGVRQAEISRLEHDHVTLPRRARLEQIARALDIPMGVLLARSGWTGADNELTPRADLLELANVIDAEVPSPEPLHMEHVRSATLRNGTTSDLLSALLRSEQLIAHTQQIILTAQTSFTRTQLAGVARLADLGRQQIDDEY